MEFLEYIKEYLPDIFLLAADFLILLFYHKLFGGKSKSSKLLEKQEKKVARDYERLKADESVLEDMKKGGDS